jgi:phosphoribosylglycinamide formyltransferase
VSAATRADIPVINLHPALPGQFDGANAIERAYEAYRKGEVTKSGAMVHKVVKDVDKGKPIVVEEVAFVEGESMEDYQTRLHTVEHKIVVQAVKSVLDEN